MRYYYKEVCMAFTTRTRKRDARILSPYVNKESYYPSGPNGMDSPYAVDALWGAGGYTGQFKSIDDVSTPGFHNRVKHGDVIMNPMAISRIERSADVNAFVDSGVILCNTGSDAGTVWGRVVLRGDIAAMVEAKTPFSGISLNSEVEHLADGALIDAFAKMKEPPVLAGEAIADIGQTLNMLRRPFNSSLDLVGRMVKSRNKRIGKTSASAAKATANAWLEYRYGWKPLMLDCKTIVQQAAKLRHKFEVQHLVSRSQQNLVRNKAADFVRTGLGSFTSAEIKGHVNLQLEERGCAGVLYDLKTESYSEQIVRALGLRLSDVPATFWEIIPYSFVVDWFISVGPWLRAITPDPSINVRGYWTTTVSKQTQELSPSVMNFRIVSGTKLDYILKLILPGSVYIDEQVRRSVDRPMPITPSLTTTSLSLTHTADGLALMTGKIINGLRDMRH
jgi:hypothetical protein